MRSRNEVKEPPEGFKQWMNDNSENIAKSKNKPYFVRDNFSEEQIQNGDWEFRRNEADNVDNAGNETQAEENGTAIQGNASKPQRKPKPIRSASDVARTMDNWRQSREIATAIKERKDNEAIVAGILGITQGKPMTFIDANEQRGNPNFGQSRQYGINCQSCVVANELRRRGFDVEARGNTGRRGTVPSELARHTEKAWIDPKTKRTPISQIAGGINKSYNIMINEFDAFTTAKGRYHIKFGWRNSNSGHIITAERLSDGSLRIYDPQTGQIISDWTAYSNRFLLSYGLRVLRIDDLLINTNIVAGIVKETI